MFNCGQPPRLSLKRLDQFDQSIAVQAIERKLEQVVDERGKVFFELPCADLGVSARCIEHTFDSTENC
jgi:hypothetical protein